MTPVPSIPPAVRSEQLVTTLNDRLRRINEAVAVAATTGPVAAAGTLYAAFASASLSLTSGTYADVPGVTLTLPAGRYLITACFDFLGSGAADAGASAQGRLMAAGVAQTGLAEFQPLVLAGGGVTGSPVAMRGTVMQQWAYTAISTAVVKLQAQRTGGTGASLAQTNTSITAISI